MVLRKLCFLMLKCIDVHPDGSKYYFRKDTREFDIPHVVLEKDGKFRKLSKKDCELYLNSIEGNEGCGFSCEYLTSKEELHWNTVYKKYGDKREFNKISTPDNERLKTLSLRGVDISRCL